MAAQYKKSKIPGIRYKEHDSRKVGIQKDRYYYMFYRLDGKQKEEGLGWASQGWTEKKVAALVFEIKNNIKLGQHPQSFKEMREMNEKAKKEEEIETQESLAERITFDEVFERYLPVHKTETTEKTWKRTESCYRIWIAQKLGARKLIEITVDNIQPIITEAMETRAPRTADYIKTVIRQVFNFAKKRDLYFKDNPAMKIKVKQKDNKRNRFLTPEEIQILLEELKKHSIDMHDIAMFSVYEGARAGAIFALQWKDIDWKTDTIALLDTKNGETYFQPLHPVIKKMLECRYAEDKEGFVFKSRDGGRIKEVSKTYQRVIDKLGFNDGITDSRQKVVFHSLRHTYASQLVMKGIDLYTTQKLMGHKSNQMTQRYAHLAPDHLKKAILKLNYEA